MAFIPVGVQITHADAFLKAYKYNGDDCIKNGGKIYGNGHIDYAIKRRSYTHYTNVVSTISGTYKLSNSNLSRYERIGAYITRTDDVIFTDNLLFHGLVNNSERIESKNLRNLVTKIENYNEWLANNEKYDTSFFSIGDGIAVSVKKNG